MTAPETESTDELHAEQARDLITAMLPVSVWDDATGHAFKATETDTVWEYVGGAIQDIDPNPSSRADVRVIAHLPEEYDLGNSRTLNHYATDTENAEPTLNRFKRLDGGVFLDLELEYRGRRTYALSIYLGEFEFDD